MEDSKYSQIHVEVALLYISIYTHTHFSNHSGKSTKQKAT